MNSPPFDEAHNVYNMAITTKNYSQNYWVHTRVLASPNPKTPE